ncbi:glycosyltransferase family 2 protein [Candidatus Uhrbacteria bacterium]|nr:glycosyltransferase family 2 protein [Candidatus Uhrbacteria bacterium]
MIRGAQHIAAIVPAYNEEQTIGTVVHELVHSGFFSEVIVVDDGSKDRTADRAKEKGATVYVQKKNSGKGGAMQYGVQKTNAPILFFCDADLLGLRAEHIRTLITPVQSGHASMCVGLRDRGLIGTWLMRMLPLIGGERALLREVFETIPAKHLVGYRAELMMNARCRALGGVIEKRVLRGLHIRRKIDKVGLWKGSYGYLKMFAQLVHAMMTIWRS